MSDDSERLSPGTYVLWVPPRGRLLHSLFRSSSSETGGDRVKSLLRASSSGSDREYALSKSPSASLSPLTAGAVAGSAANFVLASGACLVVRFGLCEVAGLGLHHLQPNVHYEPSTRTACVFSGHLANLDELADRYTAEAYAEGPVSPSSILAARSSDPRQLAAETILRMYLKERGEDLLVMLSELQGQYSFALYDGEKRQVFAARDSSGSEPLFFEVGEDGGLNLSNSQPMVPAAESSDEAHVKWAELPPGHFISGRSPKVQQFALTPEELSIRESYERSMDEEMSPRAHALSMQRRDSDPRRSLSGNNNFLVY
ncbi:Asparagine synthetase [glutamine-hydrolyzing] 1 [Chlorella vulgaris]